MRAELRRADAPDDLVAVATWDGRAAHLEVLDPSVEGIDRILRATPLVVDDPSLRRQGTHGSTMLQPGDLEWFRAAVLARAPVLGLTARIVSDVRRGGWDPASQYVTFDEAIERVVARSIR